MGEATQPEEDDDKEEVEAKKTITIKPKRRSSRRASAARALKAGTRALLRGRTKTAKKYFRSCLKRDPRLAECHKGLGTLYRREGDAARSTKHYRRYLELAPKAAEASRSRRLIRN